MDGWKINFLWEGLVSRDVVLVVTGILGGGWRQDVGLQIHTLLDSWTSLKRWIPIAYSHIAHRGNVLFFVKRFFQGGTGPVIWVNDCVIEDAQTELVQKTTPQMMGRKTTLKNFEFG